MKRKIHRRCKCGCGQITNYGRVWICGHNSFDNTNMLGKKFSEEHKKKLSLASMGNTNLLGYKHSEEAKKKLSLAHKGKKLSKEHALNNSLARIKYNPNYPYCDIWKDREYKKDIRKDYCENINCKRKSTFLINHHIYLDKKRCAPDEIMTLCNSCHTILHRLLAMRKIKPVNPKDYIIINRPDHISYIHKKSRKIIRIKKEDSVRENIIKIRSGVQDTTPA